jgi:hypothetical protein
MDGIKGIYVDFNFGSTDEMLISTHIEIIYVDYPEFAGSC